MQNPTRKQGIKCPQFIAFNNKGVCVAIKCGQWTCPDCAKTLAKKWSWRVQIHINKQKRKRAYFWTLTLSPKIQSRSFAYKILPKLWDALRKIVQRAIMRKWEYCAFVEAHPKRNGIPHFHIISLTAAPKRIKDLAVQAGFGYMADERKINSGKAAAYVAKYASKIDADMPKGFRRVRTSQGWSKLPEMDDAGIIIQKKGEFLSDYLLRVANETGLSPDEILGRYTKECQLWRQLGRFEQIDSVENP